MTGMGFFIFNYQSIDQIVQDPSNRYVIIWLRQTRRQRSL